MNLKYQQQKIKICINYKLEINNSIFNMNTEFHSKLF